MARHAKIICTVGPASSRKDTLMKMAQAGMNKARLNFSHGSHDEHQEKIDTIRQVSEEVGHKIALLQDLAGYRIRIGRLFNSLTLMKYQKVWMAQRENQTDENIPLRFDGDIKEIQPGMEVFIDDGKLFLKVLRQEEDRLELEVFQGGVLHSKKGVNIPQLDLEPDILTEKDRLDIEFGIQNRVDFVAQSFVRNAADIQRVIDIVKPRLPECLVIAKIENRQGVDNIDEIIHACDGIMVARGDLGVSLPIYQIPIIQKDIIRRCNKHKKLVVTATQMLDSMTENVRPTRAEVSDVANAILDGTDLVMLSGETAVGNYPVKSVRMMHDIIQFTEQSMEFRL